MDFGGLKQFKQWADDTFDHTLVVAQDDPMLDFFKHMNEIVDIESKDLLSKLPYERGALCDLRIVEGVGCEMFAKMAYDKMAELLTILKQDGGDRYPVNSSVRVKSVEVFEHGANSATYEG
jgi:6-pyruvoyltetrahydropterin/6-carboxytetrahydropterin synthase